MFGSIFRSAEEIAAMRASYEASQRHYNEQISRLNAEQMAAAQRAAYDNGDVIDLVPTAEGVYAVPAALEHRARSIS